MQDLDVGLEMHIGSLSLAINSLSDEVKDLHKRLDVLEDHFDLNGSLVYNSAAGEINVMDMGYPPAGYWWQIRNVVIGGSDITQTPQGVGWILIQGNWPQAANPSLVSVNDWSKTAFPWNNFYGRDEFVVVQGQHIFVLITGGTNAIEYVASFQVNQFKEFVRGRP